MEWFLLAALVILPIMATRDPAPGLTRSKERSRNLECERLGIEQGRQEHPGRIEAPKPRGDYIDRSVMACTERLMRPGLRPPRDEAILSRLEQLSSELAAAATGHAAELEERTWIVETHYPSAPVASKISFATKNALVQRGLSVSDRTPLLAVGDVAVLTQLPPAEAYPAACRRYAELGTIGEDDALLAVVNLDPRETVLHAGVCDRGQWTWLL